METQQMAERLLTETWGAVVSLEDPVSLGGSDRSHVVRYRVAGGASLAPETIVVKHAVARGAEKYDPDSTEGPAWRLFNDWAGLQFLTECFGDANDVSIPQFIAGDRTAGLIVMQDLGSGKGLDHYLLGGDAGPAADGMAALFETLGRVHAVSCGKQERFDAIRDALGPRAQKPFEEHLRWYRENPAAGLERLGIAAPGEFLSEVEEIVIECRGESPFRVYCHHDPCPDNVLWIDGRMRLLDFEFSCMANAAIDLRYPRSTWPTCWCANRTPKSLIERVERIYRAELVQGCPEAMDDHRFYRHLTAGCADSAMTMLGNSYLTWWIDKSARLGNFHPVQQLVSRLDGFVQLSDERGHFPVVAGAAREAARVIRSRMPEDFRELPIYFALRER